MLRIGHHIFLILEQNQEFRGEKKTTSKTYFSKWKQISSFINPHRKVLIRKEYKFTLCSLSLLSTPAFPHPSPGLSCSLKQAPASLSSPSPGWIFFVFLFPKLQRLFFCFCNLFPEPMEPSWLTSSISGNFLNKSLLPFRKKKKKTHNFFTGV